MDELVADRATGPPTAQERFVPIEAFFADFTIAGLDPEQHRFPFPAAFSNTHKSRSIAGRSAEKQARGGAGGERMPWSCLIARRDPILLYLSILVGPSSLLNVISDALKDCRRAYPVA
jgi:hypothetical protein